MHGFRPGKVPLKMVAQQYGPQVRQEVLGDAVQSSFGEAVRAAEPARRRLPAVRAEAARRKARRDFEFSATSRSIPRSRSATSPARTITRPQLEVGEAEVDSTLEILRKQRVTYEPVERAAENGDRVTMSYRGTIDGVEFAGGKAENQQVVLGEGRLLPGVRSAACGHEGGRRENVRAALSRTTITARKWPARRPRSR